MLKLVVKSLLTRSVRGHFATLIEVGTHLIEFNPGHISFNLFQCLFVFLLSFEGNYYIGLNDIEKNGTYVWLQGTEATSFTNWHSGQPKAGTAENS